MQWAEKLGFLALGYQTVIFIELICCGVWRSGIAAEQDVYLCPQCSRPAKIAIIAEGVTKSPLPLPWQQVEKPFPAKIRQLLLMEGIFDAGYSVKPKRQPDRHRRKARAV